MYTAGVMEFEYPAWFLAPFLLPNPTVVRYCGDSLIVSLGGHLSTPLRLGSSDQIVPLQHSRLQVLGWST